LVTIAKETQHCSIAKFSWLMVFSEIVAVCFENNMKPINTLCEQNEKLQIVKTGGTHNYHWVLKG
jgi:hypothetical protein